MTEKVVIVGSGPAGLTAAIYTGRADLKPADDRGHGTWRSAHAHDGRRELPGLPDGIMGPQLMEDFRKQAERFETRIMSYNVTKVDFSERPFKVWVEEDLYEGDTVIISTGASARWLGLENETRLRGHGVSACATCDGFFFRDKEIAVVGGGDSAAEESLFLTKFASKVYLIHRRDELRASKIMANRVLEHDKIEVIWDTVVEDVIGDDLVTGAEASQRQDRRDLRTQGRGTVPRHRSHSQHKDLRGSDRAR